MGVAGDDDPVDVHKKANDTENAARFIVFYTESERLKVEPAALWVRRHLT